MPIYELTHEALKPLARATLHQQEFREREDLQRLLRTSTEILGDKLLIFAEEFSPWADSRRRIDLLALDGSGALVVVELKRSEDGGHMDLQAIRYAAMVSTLTFQQAVAAYAGFKDVDSTEAESTLLAFLDISEPPEDFGKTVRLLLVSPDFSKELTTTVLWLNSNGLDIRCVRLRPYKLDARTLLEVDQIIPVREAQEYTVRMKEKEIEARQAAESTIDFTRYDLTVNGKLYPNLWKRGLVWQVIASSVAAGLTLEALTTIFPSRKFFVVDGHLRGEAFQVAARTAREADGYVYQPRRFYLEDDRLIDVGDKTIAVSNQWSIRTLPLLDQLIAAVPEAKISYQPAATAE